MTGIVNIEILVLELLLVVCAVAILVRIFRFQYTAALVLAGLVLSLRTPLHVDLTPDLIFTLLLPPLVFEAAYHLNLQQLRRFLPTILILAIPGVLINMLIVGGIIAAGTGLSLQIAFVFGALIAATDPVSVVAIFRKLGAPKDLEVLMEGESLFNDGTAIVVFNLALAAALTGGINIGDGVVEFLQVSLVGMGIGLILGWIVSKLISRIDDYLIATTFTTVLAFGSYLIAEHYHVSGILAVVGAGLMNGSIGEQGASATTRIVILNFWEYIAFLANSAVFLIIGLQLDINSFIGAWQNILWAIAAVLVSRAFVIYLVSRLGMRLPGRWRHMMFWGGLRGAIALALALSLPLSLGESRNTIIDMTFGVVTFTLLVQGLSIEGLMKWLGIITQSEVQVEYERRRARALAEQAGLQRLESLHDEGLLSTHTWERMFPVFNQRVQTMKTAVQRALLKDPELEVDEMRNAHREALKAKRVVLADLRRDGLVSERIYEELTTNVDIALDLEGDAWLSTILSQEDRSLIQQLVFVVIQSRDLESTVHTLSMRGFPATLIQSSGGFLQRRNKVLMVGIPEDRLSQFLDALRATCGSRVEYLSSPIGQVPMPIGVPVPVEVAGATVFVFNIERYEEL